jgi:hypothetical protein
MSDDAGGSDEDWANWLSQPEMTSEEWDAYVGTPSEWFYSLLGRVAVEAVRVDYYLVAVALQLVKGTPPTQQAILDALMANGRIHKAIDAARGASAAFNAAAEEAEQLRHRRNRYVHGVVEWGEVAIMHKDPRTGRWEESVGEGWYQQDPKPVIRGEKRLRPSSPITNDLKAEMEQTLADLQALSHRVFELGNS